jgi:hypothetical protein
LKEKLGVSNETFNLWIDEVQDGFEEMNYWALQKCSDDLDKKVTPRPLIDEMRSQTNFCKEIAHEVRYLKRDFTDMKDDFSTFGKRMKTLKEDNMELKEKLTLVTNQLSYATDMIKHMAHMIGAEGVGGSNSFVPYPQMENTNLADHTTVATTEGK